MSDDLPTMVRGSLPSQEAGNPLVPEPGTLHEPQRPPSPLVSASAVEGGPPIPSQAAESPPLPPHANDTLAAQLPHQSSTPARRRPRPPTKGILKPPPPPAKPTFGNRLRDIVNVAAGGAKSLFEPLSDVDTPGAGPSFTPSTRGGPTPSQGGSVTSTSTMSAAVGGTLNALSGRIGLGISRFVAASTSSSPSPTPNSSPLPSKSLPLPDVSGGALMSEKTRQKQPLKRATFLLPTLSIVYPISTHGEPWSEKISEDRKKIEATHRSLLTNTTGAEYWTSAKLVTLYESACRGREERPRVGIVRALEVLPVSPRPRHMHIILKLESAVSQAPLPPHSYSTDAPLNRHAAEALADVLTADWGLLDLKLENGVMEADDALKPILHALLVSGTLMSLSLAGSRRLRTGGWKLLADFLKRARSLRYIDLSDTVWDRKGIDYLVQALNSAPVQPTASTVGNPNSSATSSTSLDPRHTADPLSANAPPEEGERFDVMDALDSDKYGSFIPSAPLLKESEGPTQPAAVQTLRMDGCGLKASTLEALALGIRSSDLRNVSLRRNRIGQPGAVALALMIRDYPDSASLSSISDSMTRSASAQSLRDSHIPVPNVPGGGTYAARPKRSHPMTDSYPAEDKSLPPIPLVISSSGGGITTRTLPDGYKPPLPTKQATAMSSGSNSLFHDGALLSLNGAAVEGKMSSPELGGASIALQRSVRALDGVERIGRLLTLDLKSNEIKTGVGYIAQVLKRNRTLKVLNLSDNRIEPAGLATLSEALKYNSTLETLDVSVNPCCGPTSEGIAALRIAFTVNTSLKRLFLSDTGLTTEGAIALAEFLPESKALLHLDITSNPLVETAGILAISVGLKSNKLIRCLDLSIPPNDPELAALSQNILQACIRNTELAAATSAKDGKLPIHSQEAIWAPIKKSTLVKHVKDADGVQAERERVDLATSPEGMAREYVYKLRPEKVVLVSEDTIRDLQRWYDAAKVSQQQTFHAWEPGQLPKADFSPLLERAKALRERIADAVQDMTDPERLERMLELSDSLTSQIAPSAGFQPPPRLLLPSQIVSPNPTPAPPNRTFHNRRHMRAPSLEITSPNFSIGDSDAESDAEELDVKTIRDTTPPRQKAGFAGSGGLGFGMNEGVTSPVEKISRAWVEEEGEIFRKGTKLGVAENEEMEEKEDITGDQLKQEILDTPVERSPAREIFDEGEGPDPEEEDRQVPPASIA